VSGWVDLHIKASAMKWPGLTSAQCAAVRAKAQRRLSEHPGTDITAASTASCKSKVSPGPGSSGGVG